MDSQLNIESVLKWYIEAGLSEICGNEPLKIQTEKQKSPPPFLRQATTDLAQNMIASRQNARELSGSAKTLSELKEVVSSFEGCGLKLTAKSTVFGAGNEHASLMIIGEAPGADEDRLGLPFVGRSGRLLEKMLHAVCLKRDEVYITNVLPWRPPGNRTPTDAEVAVCLPFLKRQIELIEPKIILLLGGSAANALLENSDSISRLRGQWLEYGVSVKKKIPALASFHPAFLLRNGAQKAKAWSDFLRVLKKLKEN
ncbi:MAG: uracil-DNA glycosylase [Alphaproteobacteria bacterium]|nr:uracil-DNA glycosylase [Alphaproteobacteria bacterium]